MKVVRYEYKGAAAYGELRGEEIFPLEGALPDFRPAIGGTPVPLAEVKLKAPCEPSKIVAVGPNFLRGRAPPPRPYLWAKPTTTITDPGGVVLLPKGPPSICHEAELAIVIGRRATRVSQADALSHVFGWTCILDITASIDQKGFLEMQDFVDGKIFDTFAPFGPHIETDLDPSDLRVQCRVNGETRQNQSTSGQIWKPAELISMISHTMTLLPGDVIATGTPPGMSAIHAGDVVEAEVEGIGVLRVTVEDVKY